MLLKGSFNGSRTFFKLWYKNILELSLWLLKSMAKSHSFPWHNKAELLETVYKGNIAFLGPGGILVLNSQMCSTKQCPGCTSTWRKFLLCCTAFLPPWQAFFSFACKMRMRVVICTSNEHLNFNRLGNFSLALLLNYPVWGKRYPTMP